VSRFCYAYNEKGETNMVATAMRSRKHKKLYKKYLGSLKPEDGCIFCQLDNGDPQYISETMHFKVVRNRFPYDLWDARPVTDHLMLVPKQHTDTLKNLTAEESKEYIEQISEFENQGYNIYARTPGSTMKSIIHQHTHLIKIEPKERRRIVITSKRPFVRIAR
jgi:diadenosine tetraphosphate (Ap4A) HIT family hydrolase